MIDKYELEAERARNIAVLLENELYALRKLIEYEYEYCKSISLGSFDDFEAKRRWGFAADRINIILRAWDDMADRV